MFRAIFSVLSVLCGVGLLFVPSPFWWLGVGCLFGGGAWIAHDRWLDWHENPIWEEQVEWWFLKGKRRVLFADLFCLLIILGLAVILLGESFIGLRPIDHDHVVHYAKAWRLKDDFLWQGRLLGWSHDWFAGYPAQYLYPFGADLWIILFHTLGLGLWSFGQAYALSFGFFWFLIGASLFALSRQMFDWKVSLLAALLWMTDPGAYRMGGWVFTAVWGVWPQVLSVVWATFALAQLPKLVEGREPKAIGWFGFWMGCALLTHPMQLLNFAMLLPVIVFAYWLLKGFDRWLVSLSRLFAGYALGGMIGALWFVPFYTSKSFAQSYGAPWWTASRIGESFYQLDLFTGTWTLVTATGFVGLVAMLFSRRFLPVCLAFFSLFVLLTGSVTFSQEFHLLDLIKSFQHVQFQRFSILMKPYLFIASAYVLVAGFTSLSKLQRKSEALHPPPPAELPEPVTELTETPKDIEADDTKVSEPKASDEPPEEESEKDAVDVEHDSDVADVDEDKATETKEETSSQPVEEPPAHTSEAPVGGGLYGVTSWRTKPVGLYVLMFAVGCMIAPMLTSFFIQFGKRHFQRNLTYVRKDRFEQDKKRFVQWAKKAFAKEKHFFRLALSFGYHEHSFFDLGPRLRVPIYKIGFTPAAIYKYKMETKSRALFRTLNIKYVLSTHRMYGRDYKTAKQFGSLYLSKFLPYKPQPFTVKGKGKVVLSHWGREEIRLKADAAAQGELMLHVSAFSRWHATHNGKSIPIKVVPLKGTEKTGFMQVTLKPGTYVFSFRRSGLDWLSGIVFFIGLFCIGYLVFVHQKLDESVGVKRRVMSFVNGFVGLQERTRGMQRLLSFTVLGGALGILAVLALWSPAALGDLPIARKDIEKMTFDFGERLRFGKAWIGPAHRKGKPCRSAFSRHHCGHARWHVIEMRRLEFEKQSFKRCIWIHPQPGVAKTLSFSGVRAGDAIVGFYGITASGKMFGSHPVFLEVTIDGAVAKKVSTPQDAKTYPLVVPIPKDKKGKPVDIQFSVSAPSIGRRHFCFMAQMVKLKDDVKLQKGK
ncbi:MAG: hypothetical protein CL920_20795 [Deltaproteobacteria bacterium]|nr:hypothetical protein [Deltaproteobacteria bacterium]MBU51133.1 hypothetical protein [Deltaproteobacteria bacterium]|tara:strand:- start:15069 stop:18197 length:3129 start_codon:yes stop_codon:yes gene_type:complete